MSEGSTTLQTSARPHLSVGSDWLDLRHDAPIEPERKTVDAHQPLWDGAEELHRVGGVEFASSDTPKTALFTGTAFEVCRLPRGAG